MNQPHHPTGPHRCQRCAALPKRCPDCERRRRRWQQERRELCYEIGMPLPRRHYIG